MARAGTASSATEFGSIKSYGYDGVRGILYGDASQLCAQLLDAAVVAVFGFLMAYAWFKLSNLITPIRVSRETRDRRARRPGNGRLGLSRLHRGKPRLTLR